MDTQPIKTSGQKEKVLVTVTGLTPQVVTETLYALNQQDEIPNRIILITTQRGKNRAVRDLLDPVDGKFISFCKDYDLYGRIKFDPSCIYIIEDANGRTLDDIRTPTDNRVAADFIMTKIQQLCRDDNLSVHLSIAGGRKSMGFLAGYALSIFGRDQDRMSHVLVNEPFENNRDFYYPTPYNSIIFTPAGESLNASEAEVSLADIPFVRLRSGLTEDILFTRLTFEDVIRETQKEIAPDLTVEIIPSEDTIVCAGRSVKLPPARFLCYYWLARRKQKGQEPVRPVNEEDVTDFLSIIKEVLPETTEQYRLFKAYRKEPEDLLAFVQENLSRVNTVIKRVLGTRAKPFLIKSHRNRRGCFYSLGSEIVSITIQKVS